MSNLRRQEAITNVYNALYEVQYMLQDDPWLISTNSNHYNLSMGRPIIPMNDMFGMVYTWFTDWNHYYYWNRAMKGDNVDNIIRRLTERIRQWLRRALHNAYERTHRPLRISDEQQRKRRVQQVLGKRSAQRRGL